MSWIKTSRTEVFTDSNFGHAILSTQILR
jgi:hypothetical protein